MKRAINPPAGDLTEQKLDLAMPAPQHPEQMLSQHLLMDSECKQAQVLVAPEGFPPSAEAVASPVPP